MGGHNRFVNQGLRVEYRLLCISTNPCCSTNRSVNKIRFCMQLNFGGEELNRIFEKKERCLRQQQQLFRRGNKLTKKVENG